MKNIAELFAFSILCLCFGFGFLVFPLVSYLVWDLQWLLLIGEWSWDIRLFFLLGTAVSGFVFYFLIRYGYRQ